jgi:hypothetical protein
VDPLGSFNFQLSGYVIFVMNLDPSSNSAVSWYQINIKKSQIHMFATLKGQFTIHLCKINRYIVADAKWFEIF